MGERKVTIPMWVVFVMTMTFIEVVMLKVAWEYSQGVEVTTRWSKPWLAVATGFIWYAVKEEFLFRALPAMISVHWLRKMPLWFVPLSIASSVVYGLIHNNSLQGRALLSLLGFMLFVLFHKVQEHGAKYVPLGYCLVVGIHLLYNIQLKLLAVYFG